MELRYLGGRREKILQKIESMLPHRQCAARGAGQVPDAGPSTCSDENKMYAGAAPSGEFVLKFPLDVFVPYRLQFLLGALKIGATGSSCSFWESWVSVLACGTEV